MKLPTNLFALLLASLSTLSYASAPDAAPLSPVEPAKRKSPLDEFENPDGSYGQARKVEITSLMALSFHANGETVTSKLYGERVSRMIRFLTTAKPEDRLGQALRLCALAEAAQFNPELKLAAAIDEAARTLIDGKAEADNAALLAWSSRAYEAASFAACRQEGLLEAYLRTQERLKALALAPPADAESRAAVLYALGRAGRLWGDNLKIREEFQPLATKVFVEDFDSLDWQKAPPRAMSTWFFSVYAVFAEGGPTWKEWQKKAVPMLKKTQDPAGHWNPPGEDKPSAEEKLLATSYACLILSVYYRFLPKPAAAGRDLSAAAAKLGWKLPAAKR
ncbi:MAG: hypothetical protein RL095_3103 [Verrucomicrobiota bacterium]|jgi:hypothetical protein